MAKIEREVIDIRRLGTLIASLLAALLIGACGSGSDSAGPSAGPPQDPEVVQAAAQVAAAGGDAALAVAATGAARLPRDEAQRIRQVVVFGDSSAPCRASTSTRSVELNSPSRFASPTQLWNKSLIHTFTSASFTSESLLRS